MRWKLISILFFIGVLSGCASSENVQVSALAAPDVPAQYKQFAIVSDNYQPINNNLEFAEFARLTSLALVQQGYVQAREIKHAQILVALNYRVSEPRTVTDVVNTPVYPMINPYYSRRFGYHYYPYAFYRPIYEPTVYQSIYYQKTIRLQAIDASAYAKNKEVIPLWDVLMTNNGTSSDLRYIFPYMLTAAGPYIGKNSGHSVAVSVDEKDPKVSSLRSGR